MRISIGCAYNELLALGNRKITAEQAKRHILAFSSLLSEGIGNEAPDPVTLLVKPILPIRHANGKVLLFPASDGFTIIGRAGPVARFRGLVRTLDFIMDEVHDL